MYRKQQAMAFNPSPSLTGALIGKQPIVTMIFARAHVAAGPCRCFAVSSGRLLGEGSAGRHSGHDVSGGRAASWQRPAQSRGGGWGGATGW